MKITALKTDHLTEPLGFDIKKPHFSYIVEEACGKKQEKARIVVALDREFTRVVHDSGVTGEIDARAYSPSFPLEPSTRYYWKVRVWSDEGETAESEPSWFETPKDAVWRGKWISPKADKKYHMTVFRDIFIGAPVKKARMYTVGLGVYELYVNGRKQGEEYLLPGLHAYDAWIQYQTFELSLEQGDNRIEIMLGNGWYRGRFGLTKPEENYGDRLACIGEIVVWYEDGSSDIFATDASWKARRNQVVESGIYSGEVCDDTLDVSRIYETEEVAQGTRRLCPRLSPRITAHERRKPVQVIHTPAGETVLDFGQNMVGWVSFINRQKKGSRLSLRFGEILQEGNFYRDNLRTAKAEFSYVSDGVCKEVRPHFTFFGFRYVRVEGYEGTPDPADFTGVVIHSEMEERGWIETSDPLVNRLFQNAKWGQKGNFLDVPTDCPQRDERMGWTGDAQIFSGTACYNMDVYAFYVKFGQDLYNEQKKLRGSVPDVVPAVHFRGDGSTAWGDAATVIPWNVYLHYGDKGILERQYESMKAWVEYMRGEDEKYGGRRLWQSGFHYADWLSLDGPIKGGVYGATDPFYISSAYYYYSTRILHHTAEILELWEDAEAYGKLAKEIKTAFAREYFTPEGRLSVDTMTAYAVALYMGLTPENAYERTCQGLKRKLMDSGYHLSTGFVGTPCLCEALSENGMNGLAYRLLMEKEYPGWLYEVLMGATTVWERWDSVLPDGTVSGTEMNSLNHYAYGSIAEWMYRYMAGIRPVREAPGFRKAVVAPAPDYRLRRVSCRLHTASGRYTVAWEQKDKGLRLCVSVPFDCEAQLILPDADAKEVQVLTGEGTQLRQQGRNASAVLKTGSYEFFYIPSVPLRKRYGLHSLVKELLENKQTARILKEEVFDVYGSIPFAEQTPVLLDLLNGPFTRMPYEKQRKLDERLGEVVFTQK